MEERILLARIGEGIQTISDILTPELIKHTRVVYKAGKFLVEDDKPPEEAKSPEDG